MGLQLFFDSFELLAEAPNGVAKLRELILQLAVEGTLVSQNAKDESAAALLKRIEAKKAKLINTTQKALSPANEDEIPYSIPETWAWTTLGGVGLINPRNECEDDEMASFVPMKLVPQKYGDRVRTEERAWKEIKKGFTHFAEDDVVLAKITPCFQNGKAAVMRGLKNSIGAGTTELHVFRPLKGLMCSDYVLIYLKSPEFILDGIPRMTGTAGQKRVPNDYFAENPFPLPPLEEQKRIVARVDELMRLCDELEARQQVRRESRVRLNNATLAPLNNAASLAPEEFEQAAGRLGANFATLYDSAETVAKLRSTVLQLAVQGKLVPQDPHAEPASALLETLKIEKAKLIEEKAIRSAADDSLSFNQIQKPYSPPSNWRWCKISDFAVVRGGKRLPQGAAFSATVTPHIYVRVTNMKNGTILRDGLKYIDDNVFQQIEQYTIDSDDIYITIAGTIGQSGEVPEFFHGMNLTENAARLMFRGLNKQYLLLSLQSETLQRQFTEKTNQMAQPKLALKRIGAALIPLPPLEEQERIVAKVNQLMALCDELEAKLRQAEADSAKLMNAALQHVLDTVAGKGRGQRENALASSPV